MEAIEIAGLGIRQQYPAHRRLTPDGLIPEIPASFGRASLNIKGLGSAAPMVQFRIGKYLTDLPSCVTHLIRTKSRSDIRVTGSWYHDEKTVPYYVNVKFYDPGNDSGRRGKSNYSFLFNLRTAQLISITRFEADRSGNGGTDTTIELPKGCHALGANIVGIYDGSALEPASET